MKSFSLVIAILTGIIYVRESSVLGVHNSDEEEATVSTSCNSTVTLITVQEDNYYQLLSIGKYDISYFDKNKAPIKNSACRMHICYINAL